MDMSFSQWRIKKRAKRPFRLSIQQQISHGFGVILIIVSFISTIIIFNSIRHIEEESWHDRQQEAARRASNVVSSYLIQAEDSLFQVGLLNEHQLKEEEYPLDELLNKNIAVDELLFLNSDGQIIASATRDEPILASLFTIKQSVWFQKALAGEIYFSPIQNAPNGELYLIIAVPGENVVVAGRLPMRLLKQVVSNVHFGESGAAYVLDDTGEIIVHGDHQMSQEIDSLIESRKAIQQMLAAPDRKWAGTYNNGVGQNVIGSSWPVENTNWTIVLEILDSEVHANSNKTRRDLLILATILSFSTMFFATRLLNRMIFKPLRKLNEGAASIERGDLSARIQFDRHDEIGNVAEAFNKMAESLQRRNKELAVQTASLEAEISERKEAESEIRRQKQYFEAVVNHSPIAIVVLETDGRISSCNVAFEHLFGWKEWEIVGINIDEMIAPESLRAEAVSMTRDVQAGNLSVAKTKRCRKDGSLVDVEVFGVHVVADDQKIGVLGLYHDITDRVASEQALRQAKEVAEDATRAKSEFLANMSHEIRTPLNGVIGMTGLLLDSEMSSEQNEFVHIIRKSGDALLSIINDILDFSKIEAGKLELENHPFDVRQCLEEALDLLASKATKKGLELAYIVDRMLPPVVLGDVTRLRQVLVNLLGNAVKFTDAGEIFISVLSQPIGNNRHNIYFAVKDTGIGIPHDRMNRLFRSFSQVDSSTTRKFGGTGLGLVISQRLAKLMGGEMWVDSQLGEGATFHFSIQVTADSESEIQRKSQDSGSLAGKRLLIVDDNETSRFVLSRQSANWGMIPTAVSSGAAALNLLQTGQTFDIAILDMQMPEMDGLMLAEQIRETISEKQLPLIMLTSLGQSLGDKRSQLLAAYLAKPIKPAQLHKILEQTCSQDVVKRDAVEIDKKIELDHTLGETVPLRILLAEDHLINQKVALRVLERLGYRADLAANGYEVLDALRQQRYDIVFMDIQMPEMDGVEATHEIHQMWAESERPYIIAMTAHALVGDKEFYLSQGMDDYVSKPIDIENLVRAIKNSRPFLMQLVPE